MLGRKLACLVIVISLMVLTFFVTGCAPEDKTEDEQAKQDKDEPNEYEVEVQADPEEAGEIEGEGTYEEGEEVKIEAEPKEGYEFEKWEEDGEKITSDKDYKLEVGEDVTLEAQFEKEEHEVTVDIKEENNENVKGENNVRGERSYEYGEQVIIEALPDIFHEFESWEINGEKVSSNKEYSFKIKEDIELIANFRESINITDENIKKIISEQYSETAAIEEVDFLNLTEAEDDIEDLSSLKELPNLESLSLDIEYLQETRFLQELDLERLSFEDTAGTARFNNLTWSPDENYVAFQLSDNVEGMPRDVRVIKDEQLVGEVLDDPQKFREKSHSFDDLAPKDDLFMVTPGANHPFQKFYWEEDNKLKVKFADYVFEWHTDDNKIKIDDTSTLSQLEDLKEFELIGVSNVGEDRLENLAEADNLEELDLRGTEVTEDMVEDLEDAGIDVTY